MINNMTVVRLLNLGPGISKNEEIDSIPLKNHGLMPCCFPINYIKEGIFNVYFLYESLPNDSKNQTDCALKKASYRTFEHFYVVEFQTY